MEYAALVPIIFRFLGLAKYSAEAIKLLPAVIKYGPMIMAWIKSGMNAWEQLRVAHPALAAFLEGLAVKLFPASPALDRKEVTTVGIFLPGHMTPEYEKLWLDHRSDVGTSG